MTLPRRSIIYAGAKGSAYLYLDRSFSETVQGADPSYLHKNLVLLLSPAIARMNPVNYVIGTLRPSHIELRRST